MGEPNPERNRDQDVPSRTGEKIGSREPLGPPPIPGEFEPRPKRGEDSRKSDRSSGSE